MAALRGVMDYGHHAESISRLAHDVISARLSTWRTHVYCSVDKYGRVHVQIERDNKEIKRFDFTEPEIPAEEMKKDQERRRKKRERDY